SREAHHSSRIRSRRREELCTADGRNFELHRDFMNELRQFSLDGKVAVVTGSSRGIGRAIAEGLADAGAAVAVNGRNPESTRTVADAIASAGGKSLAVPADISKSEEVARLIDVTVATFGRLDILVNNAGISPYYKPAEAMTEAEWDEVININ